MLQPTNEIENTQSESRCAKFQNYLQTRYVLTFMGFLGFANVYALRVNLSIAMVAMVNGTSSDSSSNLTECITHKNHTTNSTLSADNMSNGEFNWTSDVQGVILGAFFYGYIITQIPGGRMAELFGAKWLFGIGVLCTSVLTLLTPLAARASISWLITVRVLEGLGEGVTFPAMHCMIGRWYSKSERSLHSTIIYSGSQIGTVISMPISGLLASSNFLGGWPSVFYVFGIIGCIWFIFWIVIIHDSPAKHPRISEDELIYIQQNADSIQDKKALPIPIKSILSSVPVWTLVVTHFGQNWGFYTLLTELPSYLGKVLQFDIKQNGSLSALPYLLQAIMSCFAGYFADTLRRKGTFKIGTIRKICNSIAFFIPAACFVGVVLAKCNHVLSVLFFTLAMGFNGFMYAGFMVTHVDMSPDFAGTLMGMTNCVGNFAGFLAPIAVGYLTKNNETLHQWSIVFYLATGIYIFTGILYVVFASAKLQSWGQVSILKEEEDEKKH